MKKMMTLAALILGFTTAAQANVPYLDCSAHDAPVLSVIASAGLIYQGVISREVRLFANGDVQVKTITMIREGDKARTERATYDSLWSETPEVMAKIQLAIQKLKGTSKLVDTDPNAPQMADGPGYTYLACQNGAQVSFANSYNGHDYLPKNATEAKAARYLRADLQNLLKAVVDQQP